MEIVSQQESTYRLRTRVFELYEKLDLNPDDPNLLHQIDNLENKIQEIEDGEIPTSEL